MPELSARRLDAHISEASALATFNEWLEQGFFTRKQTKDSINSHVEYFDLCFVRVQVQAEGYWNGQVASLNQREWNRDWNTYLRDEKHWEALGKRGTIPRRPDKEHYYEWHEERGSWKDVFQCTLPAFGTSQLASNSKITRVCTGFNAHAWDHWPSAGSIPFDDVLPLIDNDVISPSITDAGLRRFRDWHKTNVERQFDKALKPGHEINYERVRTEALLVPFLNLDYSFDGTNYRFVTDLVEGSCFGGNKPKDSKKIAWAAGIAASVVAVTGGSYAAFGPTDAVVGSHPLASVNLEGASGQNQLPTVTLPAGAPEPVKAFTSTPLVSAGPSAADLSAQRSTSELVENPNGTLSDQASGANNVAGGQKQVKQEAVQTSATYNAEENKEHDQAQLAERATQQQQARLDSDRSACVAAIQSLDPQNRIHALAEKYNDALRANTVTADAYTKGSNRINQAASIFSRYYAQLEITNDANECARIAQEGKERISALVSPL